MKRENKKSVFVMLGILIITVCCPMIQQGIICNDELLLRLWSQQGLKTFFRTTIINENILKGRILATIGNVKFLSYLSDNKYVFRTIGVCFLLISIFLFGCIVYRLFEDIYFSTVLCILILVFLPITFELSVPNAYMIVCLQPLILLEISIALFINYVEKGKHINFILCSLMFLWAMFLYEFIITYVLIFPIIYILKYQKEIKNIKIKVINTIKKTFPLFCVAIVYLMFYLLQAKIFPTNYLGNTLKIFSFRKIFSTLKVVFLSALPGYFTIFNQKYRFLFEYYNHGKIHIQNLYKSSFLVFVVALSYLLITILNNKNEKKYKLGKSDILIIGTALIYGMLPALPNALTPLYQEAVSNSGFISIPVSIYLYFSNMLAITYFLWKICKAFNKKYVKIVFICLALMGSGFIQIENNVFAEEQSQNYERIVDIENLLKLNYWNQFGNIVIEAPSLYETKNTLAVEEDHWTQFANIYHSGMVVENKTEENPDLYIQMQKDNSFYVYNNTIKLLICENEQEGKICLEDEESNYIQMEIDSCIDREQKYNVYLLK